VGFFLVVVSQEGHKCLGYALKLSATVDFLQIDDHSPDIYNFVFHVVYCRFLQRIRTGRMDRMALLLTLLYFVSTIWIFSYILSFLGLPKNHIERWTAQQILDALKSLDKIFSAEDLFNQAYEQQSHGDYEIAISKYTEAIQLKPDYIIAYAGRARAFKLINRQFKDEMQHLEIFA
jgi:tetratricopeptide (TPR) repeat protein